MIKIKIADLIEGINRFSFVQTHEALGIEEALPFANEIHVAVFVEKSQGNIYVKAHVATLANFTCHRCLKDFQREVAAEVDLYYTPEGSPADLLEADTDMRWLAPGTPEIDLTKDLYDILMLTLPIKVLCDENCRGLCPRCGADLNEGPCGCSVEEIDPRWELLKKL